MIWAPALITIFSSAVVALGWNLMEDENLWKPPRRPSAARLRWARTQMMGCFVLWLFVIWGMYVVGTNV